MKVTHKDFIAVYENVYPEGYCEHVIEQFELLDSKGVSYNRQQSENASKLSKNDQAICANLRGHNLEPFNNKSTMDVFFDGLQMCFEEYTEQYPLLKNIKLRASDMKMQRTSPMGGYHVWHAEQGNGTQAHRGVVYMLYLNTLNESQAGETEFLYQQQRIRPVKNTMILWPAAFTHTHRGNTVFGEGCKYVITGWFYHD